MKKLMMKTVLGALCLVLGAGAARTAGSTSGVTVTSASSATASTSSEVE